MHEVALQTSKHAWMLERDTMQCQDELSDMSSLLPNNEMLCATVSFVPHRAVLCGWAGPLQSITAAQILGTISNQLTKVTCEVVSHLQLSS